MNGLLFLLGIAVFIEAFCDGWDALNRRRDRVVPHPFDWDKDPEETR